MFLPSAFVSKCKTNRIVDQPLTVFWASSSTTSTEVAFTACKVSREGVVTASCATTDVAVRVVIARSSSLIFSTDTVCGHWRRRGVGRIGYGVSVLGRLRLSKLCVFMFTRLLTCRATSNINIRCGSSVPPRFLLFLEGSARVFISVAIITMLTRCTINNESTTSLGSTMC